MDINRKEFSTIKEVLKDSPRGMTVTEISKTVKMNRHSVAKYMEVLVAAGHVDMRAFGPSKVYFLSQRVPVSAMLSFSSDLIVTLDKDMRARNVNDKFLEFMGLDREEMLNKNIEKFSYPMKMDPPLLPYIKAALKGKEASVDAFYPKDAEGTYFIVKYLPTVFEDGENGVTLILTDITERKRIENAIRESERKFRDMLEQSTDGISMSDERGIVIEYNKGYEQLTGLAKSDVVGKYVWDIPFFIKGYGQIPNRNPKKLKDYINKFLKTGKSPLTDRFNLFNIERPDGSIRIVLVNVFPIKTNKGYILCSIVHDITERVKAEEALLRERAELEVRVKERTIELEDANRTLKAEIGQRIRSENALRESEEKYRNLTENIIDVAWEMDREGRFTYMSPKMKDLLGYEPRDFIGKAILEFMPPEDADRLTVNYRESIGDQGIYGIFVSRLVHKDGHEVIVEANGSPAYDGEGNFWGYRGVTRDVTARKQAEDAQRKAEEKYRNLVESINDVAWELGKDGAFTYISPRISDTLGYEPSDFIGKTVLDFMPPAIAEKMREEYRRMFNEPKRYNVEESRLLHKDGHEVIVEANGTAMYDGEGNFQGYRGVTRDVTDRKQAEEAQRKAEEKYRTIVENVYDWIWETDNAGRFVYSSPRVHDILGYRPEELIGLRPFDMTLPENGKKMYHRLMAIARKGEPFTGLEGAHLHKDGHTVFVEVSGKPVYDKQGAVVGYTGIAHDITERKIAEEKLLQNTSELKAIFHAFPDIIFRTARDGTIIYYNTARADYLNAPPEAILGKKIGDLLPEDARWAAAAALEQINATGRMAAIEYRLRIGDRDETFEARLLPAPEEQIIIIVRPITDKKRLEAALHVSEGKFRSLVENIDDIAWEMDENARFTYVSPKVRDILGYAPAHYIGRIITEFMPPEDLPVFSPGFDRIFAAPKPYALENLRLFHVDGSIHSMEVNGTPFYDEERRFRGFRGVLRDVTKQKRMEEMLSMMKDSMAVTRNGIPGKSPHGIPGKSPQPDPR